AADLPAPSIASYEEKTLRFATAAWPMRAAEELRSALIFRALYKASQRAGLTGDWPARVASGVHDELRHSRLCAEVGARVGAPRPRYDATPVRARLSGLPDPLLRAASLLLVELAIGETISTYLFRAGYRLAPLRSPLGGGVGGGGGAADARGPPIHPGRRGPPPAPRLGRHRCALADVARGAPRRASAPRREGARGGRAADSKAGHALAQGAASLRHGVRRAWRASPRAARRGLLLRRRAVRRAAARAPRARRSAGVGAALQGSVGLPRLCCG